MNDQNRCVHLKSNDNDMYCNKQNCLPPTKTISTYLYLFMFYIFMHVDINKHVCLPSQSSVKDPDAREEKERIDSRGCLRNWGRTSRELWKHHQSLLGRRRHHLALIAASIATSRIHHSVCFRSSPKPALPSCHWVLCVVRVTIVIIRHLWLL